MADDTKKKVKIVKPVSKGVAKVPVIMQMEALECGAASLAMVLAYYRKWIPLEQVRSDCGVSRDGSNMKAIYIAAQHYGLEVHGYRLEVESLKTKVSYPCIIHWNMNHFVVLNGFKGNKAVINDPARGTVQVPMDEVNKSFTGIVLTFEPSESFEPSGKKRSVLQFAKSRLKGASSAVAFVVLVSIISYLFGVINPVMQRVFFDYLLSGNAVDWLVPFIVILSVLTAFQLFVEWTKVVYSLKINGKMDIEGNASYMWKVLHLPMDFFSQRLIGDILQRQSTNAGIANTLIQTVAPLVLNTAMMFFYLFVMLRYSVIMTLVGIGCLGINILIAQYMSRKRVNMTRVQMRDSGKLASATLAGISMAETIKSAGAEGGFFRKWSGYQAAVISSYQQFYALNLKVGMIPQFISSISGYIILFLGIVLTMQGNFTVGMITSFQGVLTAFMGPASTLVSAGQTIQEMRTSMERVEDVMNYQDDPLFREEDVTEDTDYKKLGGEIEFKNVTFGYSPLAEPIIKDFSMHLEPGKRIAIVGASGCGKSTVSKLATGLYMPWSGEILYDGKPISEIPRSVFTSSVAMVDQEIMLFEDTIANNIRMWDNTIEDYDIILAARDAQIHEDIVERAGGYQAKLIERGRNLSGGQRQRIEIARTLAMDPSTVIMDEATSALDAKTEYELVKAVNARGISCIVVAHRLSTIRDCDEIIVLKDGVIVERGTHDELIAMGGAYKDLVTSD